MSHVKVSEAKLHAILDLVCDGVMVLGDQAKAVDVSRNTLREWMKRSNDGDPLFELTFLGRTMQFAEAYKLATRFAYRELRAKAEQKSIHGYDRRTLCQGQYVVLLDPLALRFTVEERRMLGFHEDAYLLDANGCVQYVTEHVEPPVKLQMKFLETFPDLQPTTHANVNLRGQVSLGVGVIRTPDYSKPPPAIPAPTIPELEVLSEEVGLGKDDDALLDLLGPEPVSVVVVEHAVVAEQTMVEPTDHHVVVEQPRVPSASVMDMLRPRAPATGDPIEHVGADQKVRAGG